MTAENRTEYVHLALQYRLHEFDLVVAAVREGMSKVVPVPLLSLFTGFELEAMVCGSPDIPIGLLKAVATYKGERALAKVRFIEEKFVQYENFFQRLGFRSS